MLVLSRKLEEEIVIGDEIRVKIIKIGPKYVKLAITAPQETTVHRMEVYERKIEEEVVIGNEIMEVHEKSQKEKGE